MRILSLDLSKFKTVACDYEVKSRRHEFATVPTTLKALHDLIVDREPDRVVIEICSIAGCPGPTRKIPHSQDVEEISAIGRNSQLDLK